MAKFHFLKKTIENLSNHHVPLSNNPSTGEDLGVTGILPVLSHPSFPKTQTSMLPE
jgi:hypothetical protein